METRILETTGKAGEILYYPQYYRESRWRKKGRWLFWYNYTDVSKYKKYFYSIEICKTFIDEVIERRRKEQLKKDNEIIVKEKYIKYP